MKTEIDRGFVRIGAGQIHYRRAGVAGAGSNLPLIMAHGGPGSSAGLVPLIADLAADRLVVAPDMMGNGASDPPPNRETSIGFYADCLIATLDALGLETVDLYGHHTGAQVVCELAITCPARVRHIVLDGLGLFPAEMRAEFHHRYAPDIVPDEAGSHLLWVWDFIRNTTQYFPHYTHDASHRIAAGVALPPHTVTDRAAEVIQNWSTWNLAYRAAFDHDIAQRLPAIRTPVTILDVEGDPLSRYVAEAARLLPRAQVLATSRIDRLAVVRAALA